MATQGPGAAAARARFRERMEARGHVVDNARLALSGLEADLAAGVLEPTTLLEQFAADLRRALEQDDGQKLGGKSAEAARFIGRAIARELENA